MRSTKLEQPVERAYPDAFSGVPSVAVVALKPEIAHPVTQCIKLEPYAKVDPHYLKLTGSATQAHQPAASNQPVQPEYAQRSHPGTQ